MLGYTWWAICHAVPHAVHNDNCVYRSTCAVFFLSSYSVTYAHAQSLNWYTCLHEMLSQIFSELVVLRVLAELNASKITHIACARSTTHYFKSNCTVLTVAIATDIIGGSY